MDQQTTTTPAVSTMTTTTTDLMPNEPGNVFILVMGDRLERTYLTSGDGSLEVPATISVPNGPKDDYAKYATHALVNGKLHIFGGSYDSIKVARLEGCVLTKLPARLKEERVSYSAALSIENGSKALICFGGDGKSCETFDGVSTASTFSTNWIHNSGGLGFYQGQPASVGSRRFSESHNKAETLTTTGWTALPDHPLENIYEHSLVGLENQSMLLLGGRVYDGKDYEIQTGIWQLQNGHWSRIGELWKKAYRGSTLFINKSIYYFALESPYPIQRIDLSEDEQLEKVEWIGVQPSSSFDSPVLFQTPGSNYCV